MTLLNDLKTTVSGYLVGSYETYEPRDVPLPENIGLGNKAAKFTASALFVDVRQSSDITEAFRLQTAAKMMKSYFRGAVKIVNANNGYVKSFNGDGMLAFFMGDFRSNMPPKRPCSCAGSLTKVFVHSFGATSRTTPPPSAKRSTSQLGVGSTTARSSRSELVSREQTTSPGSDGRRTPLPSLRATLTPTEFVSLGRSTSDSIRTRNSQMGSTCGRTRSWKQ
jgi:hypothetical protein